MQSHSHTQGSSKCLQKDGAHGKAAKLREEGPALLEGDGVAGWEGAGLEGVGDPLANPKSCLRTLF